MSPPIARTRSLMTAGPRRSVELRERKTSSEWEAVSVIVQYQLPQTILRAEAHNRRLRATVLADVDQAFLYNPHQFPAGSRRKRNFLQIGDEAYGNASVSGEAFHEIGNKVKKLMRSDVDRTHSVHQVAKVQDLVPQQTLDAFQFPGNHWIVMVTTTQHIDLHFDADQRLNRRVVQFARDSGAFAGSCAGTRIPTPGKPSTAPEQPAA